MSDTITITQLFNGQPRRTYHVNTVADAVAKIRRLRSAGEGWGARLVVTPETTQAIEAAGGYVDVTGGYVLAGEVL